MVFLSSYELLIFSEHSGVSQEIPQIPGKKTKHTLLN